MDEQIISGLRTQSAELRQRLEDAYSRAEEGFALTIEYNQIQPGRRTAAVLLRENEPLRPLCRHDYIELLYAQEGRIIRIIDKKELVLEKGDILLMNQYVEQQAPPMERGALGISLLAQPDFFEKPLQMLKKQSLITDFLTNMLRRGDRTPQYLLFRLEDPRALENLMENLAAALPDGEGASSEISQYTTGLIFLCLSDHMDRVAQDSSQSYKSIIIQETLKYIEQNYRTARLGQIAEDFGLTLPSISKLIKEGMGSTFQELLMKRRFERAAQLLIETDLPVEEIALNVGYENQSYFHRQFKQRYRLTPRRYRLMHRRRLGGGMQST